MRLIPDWRRAHRFLSIQLMVASGTVQAAFLAFPSELKEYLPDWLLKTTAIVLLFGAIFGRFVKQKERRHDPRSPD